MASSFGFPDWVPWWVQLLVLIVGILIALAFMLMPFSVFGVKSRLDGIEARLDDIQGDIRVLALRLQEAPRRPVVEENPVPVAPPAYPAQARAGAGGMDAGWRGAPADWRGGAAGTAGARAVAAAGGAAIGPVPVVRIP